MNKLARTVAISNAKRYSKWFSVDLTIRLFGHVIFEYHWPPLASGDVEPSNSISDEEV